MVRSHLLAALAPIVLVACAHTEAFRSFALDVPAGWDVLELDQSLVVAEPKSAWVWEFFWFKDARELQEHEGGVTSAGREMARNILVDEPANEGAFSLGEPVELDLGEGIVAVEMNGRAVTAGMAVGVRMVIAIAGEEALVGIGLRYSEAGDRADARSEGLVRSIRMRP